ncbi:haloacid dehalogenase type II [Actinomadura sp. ATCC 31491]|uniref:Haloacid dehalogenase type II n=1 Tax=Actinomadura luzonensis TaxID=2805427 RepID=A0ABT0FLS4_9ACTN|nr:haloacid dehalogenase type II [Actinomadura luzonensis]MCK2213263.1 haloacid dehalogenase type II [Actinomadura luzonensis]
MTPPQAVIFDVNETLTDMEPLRARFEEAGLPGHLMDTWFASVLRDGFALTAAGGYAGFAEVARDVLTGMGLAEQGVAHVLGGFAALRVHPDVPEGMRMLRAAGVRLFTMTNGAAAMTEGILAREGLLDLVEARLDVSGPRAWKPARAAYEYAVARAGVRPDEAALVAVHPWDVEGAQRAGLVGAYLDRRGTPYPSVLGAPRVSAPDLPALAAALTRAAG